MTSVRLLGIVFCYRDMILTILTRFKKNQSYHSFFNSIS